MKVKVKEYKDWLFVKIENGEQDFEIVSHETGFLCLDNKTVTRNGKRVQYCSAIYPEYPGSYQIIGKWDTIDWEGIDTWAIDGTVLYETKKEAAMEILRSLGMEPGTTLVLKKQT